MSTPDLPAVPAVPEPPDPRTVLDDEKRWKIITLISNGSSRRMAAKYVGCAASTITRTALRDPDFAEQLAAAELNAEIESLRLVRTPLAKPATGGRPPGSSNTETPRTSPAAHPTPSRSISSAR